MLRALLRKKPVVLTGLLQFDERRVRKIRRRAVFLEQLLRDDIDALVRALRGKNRGNEQFQRTCRDPVRSALRDRSGRARR